MITHNIAQTTTHGDDAYAWQPACGGLELPFDYDGKTYLYMWNTETGEHSYYCMTDDVFVGEEL